jgi:hypothetical protein
MRACFEEAKDIATVPDYCPTYAIFIAHSTFTTGSPLVLPRHYPRPTPCRRNCLSAAKQCELWDVCVCVQIPRMGKRFRWEPVRQ